MPAQRNRCISLAIRGRSHQSRFGARPLNSACPRCLFETSGLFCFPTHTSPPHTPRAHAHHVPAHPPRHPPTFLSRLQPLPPSPFPHRNPPQPAAPVSPLCAHPRNAADGVDASTPLRHSASLRHFATSVLRSPFSVLFTLLRHFATSVLRSPFSVLCSLHSSPPLRHSATRPLDHLTTISFNPDPATTDAILQAIAADYSLSLTDIANQHNTTIEALTAWLTREDIDERLTAIESACARRARLTAANHLPAVAHVAKQALEEASDVLRLPPDYRTQRSIALRIRATESARKAAALLLRIANFTPGPRRVRHNAAPTSPRITPPPAPPIAARAEIALAAPTSATTAASPTDLARSAPGSLPPAESAHATPTAASPTDRAATTSASAPRAVNTPTAPTPLPPTKSTPSAHSALRSGTSPPSTTRPLDHSTIPALSCPPPPPPLPLSSPPTHRRIPGMCQAPSGRACRTRTWGTLRRRAPPSHGAASTAPRHPSQPRTATAAPTCARAATDPLPSQTTAARHRQGSDGPPAAPASPGSAIPASIRPSC